MIPPHSASENSSSVYTRRFCRNESIYTTYILLVPRNLEHF